MSKVKVSKIVIDLGKDRAIELTIEQARDLQAILNETLGKRETVYVPSAPVIIDLWPWYQPYPWYSGSHWSVSVGDTVTHPLDASNTITSGAITYSLNSGGPVS